MSKLAGHLLQTTPLVLAASLVAQQGASATTATPVDNPEASATPPVAVASAVAPATEFQPKPSILANDYAAPTPTAPTVVTPAPEPVVASPAPTAPEPIVTASAPASVTSEPTVTASAPVPVSVAPTTPPEVAAAEPVSTVAPAPSLDEPQPESAIAPAAPTPATIADFKTVKTNANALQSPASSPVSRLEPAEVVAPVTAQPEFDAPTVDAPAIVPTTVVPATPSPQPSTEVDGLDELEVGAPELPAPAPPLTFEATVEASDRPTPHTQPRLKQPTTAPMARDEFVDLDGAIADLEQQQPTVVSAPETHETPTGVVGRVTPPSADISPTEEDFLDLDPAIANLQPISDAAFDALLERIVRENSDVVAPTIAQEQIAQEQSDASEDAQVSDREVRDELVELAVETTASDAGFDILKNTAVDWQTFASLTFETLEELEPQMISEAATLSVDEILEQVNAYSTEESNGSLGQSVLSASQFADVFPSDWAYTALDDLVRRYDCIRGYPDGTFRGGRALSRYEFAAGLNACIQQVERLIAETTADLATRADLEVIGNLMREFEVEINTLNARVDAMEGRVTFLEDNQFSTTTKLAGEVLFAVADLFTEAQLFDSNYDGVINTSDTRFTGSETVFQDRVRLNLLTTFNGRDRLLTRLQARNAVQFDAFNPNSSNVDQVTNEGRWAFAGNSNDNNAVEISELNYRTPLGSKFIVQIAAVGLSADEIVDSTLNPFDSSGGGALSRFGQGNPIYNVGSNDAGIGINFIPNEKITLSVGYTNETAAEAGSGVFQDGYNFISQLTFRPNDKVAVAATFSHAYDDTSLSIDTGSRGANLRQSSANLRNVNTQPRPVVGNSYGIETLVNVNETVFLGGWVGYTFARVTGVGDADIWNYAVFGGVNDLGGEGNQLGVIIGMEPRLDDADAAVGAADRSTGLHIEGFYKIRVNKNVEITPGVVWLTAPDHNSENTDMVAGVIRTRFKF
ncbi:MAG: iron uptake porin [Cyanobacteria bacterium P01_G01_bin.54]